MNTSLIFICFAVLTEDYTAYISFAAFLVGILAILVTSLICWQVFNYMFIKREMSGIVKSALKDFQKDSVYVLKGVINMSNSKALMWCRFAQALDDVMISLEEVLKSKNAELNKFAIDILMDNLMMIKNGMSKSGKPWIYKDRRKFYLGILKLITHPNKKDIVSMIENSEEIENNRSNNLNFIAENEMGVRN